MRKELPSKRRNWTQHVTIAGQSVYLCVGEYEDGRPGEVFLDIARQGTLLRGIMGTLARSVSIALQCGATVETVVEMLREIDYPPNGPVQGSEDVNECISVTDWVARELEARYLRPQQPRQAGIDEEWMPEDSWPGQGDVMSEADTVVDQPVPPRPPTKVAGRPSEGWRTGI